MFSNSNELTDGTKSAPIQKSIGGTIAKIGLLCALTGVLLLAVCDTGHSNSAMRNGKSHAAVGVLLSDFKLSPLTSAAGLTSEELRGKVGVVNLWGPWCYYCRIEFPKLVELDERLSKNENYRFVSISYGASAGEPPAQLKSQVDSVLRQNKAKFQAYADSNGTAKRALVKTAKFGGISFPTTLVLDQQGVIRGVWEGYSEGDVRQIESLVTQLLTQTSE